MKNHLFIGLGGQGGKSIAGLRKVFEQREDDASHLRKIDQKWDFLYIDSSRDVTNTRENWTHLGRNLSLNPDSFLYLKDGGEEIDPDGLGLRPDISPWIGDTSSLKRFLGDSATIQGANQRRRFGRLLYANNSDRIRKAACDDKIRPMLSNSNQCAIHIFASLAGGTGSGSIVDLVTMLRTEYPSASVDDGFPIFLYLYVTSDDYEESQVGYFHENQLATLRDLNALACGRIKPHMLGSAQGGRCFGGNEPISQIVLSTSLNDRNQQVSLEKQHKILAEAAFERIFAYCSGCLDERQQKPLTGEDRLASFAGEPIGSLMRSFRFGTTGMKRWELPTEEIEDLLVNELYCDNFNRILYRNWDESIGSLSKKLPPETSGETSLIQDLGQIIQSDLIENTSLAKLRQEMKDDFKRAVDGLKKKNFEELDLDGIEAVLKERYSQNLNGGGIDATFSAYANNRSQRLHDLTQKIGKRTEESWTRNAKTLGLAYIPDCLMSLQTNLRKNLEKSDQSPTDNSVLIRRMSDRKVEWEKQTSLSKPFRSSRLALAHTQDLVRLLSSEIREKAQQEDRLLLDQVTTSLTKLASYYKGAINTLEGWRDQKKKRKDNLYEDLLELKKGDASNNYELSAEALDDYIKSHRMEEVLLRGCSDLLLNNCILPIIQSRGVEALDVVTDDHGDNFWEAAEELIHGETRQIHNHIVERDRLEPVLTGDLLAILEGRSKQDEEKFQKELNDFLKSASSCAKIDKNQLQPKDIRDDSNMPSMPRQAMIVGLPRNHGFSKTLKNLMRPLMPAGDNTVTGFYEHEDETQIRVLVVTSWLAARFTKVVQQLQERFDRAISGASGNEKAYFVNIDKSGEEGKRPNLLLPSPEECKSEMRISLWLGQNIQCSNEGGALVQVAPERVVLMINEKDGLTPEPLGASIEEVASQSDIRVISRVYDEVSSAVTDLSEEQKSKLLDLLNEEDKGKKSELGVASAEYGEWSKDRKKIYNQLT
ncbi:tubulin-like doman-containing protein [bacterium]|nr:tubulin-like doman-containing protein [bacterium]